MNPFWSEVYDRILGDMKTIWGEMAVFMIKKRAKDVEADLANLRKVDLERIIELLRQKTLPATLGLEGADAKANQYRSWLGDGSTVTG
jgi:hypothetical protein